MSLFGLLGVDEVTPSKSEMRTCTRCGEEKHLSEFYKHRKGYDNRCIECFKKYNKELKDLKEHPETPEMPQYCDCCGRPNPKGQFYAGGRPKPNLALDHYYDSDGNPYVRGYLCSPCNSGIGYLGDTPQGVGNGIKYLLKSLPEDQKKEFLSKFIEDLEKYND